MKKLGYFLFALGFIIASFGLSMDTTVETGGQIIGSGDYSVTVPKSRVHNIGLMDDRKTILYGAGLSLLLGAILLVLELLLRTHRKGRTLPHRKLCRHSNLHSFRSSFPAQQFRLKRWEGWQRLQSNNHQ